MAAAPWNRALEDVSNIVHLEHVNLTQPDQPRAILFYVSGLGLTRDPYLMVELDNMWINIGRSQMHLPTREPQRLRGTIGLVLPDLELLKRRLAKVAPRLEGTAFEWHEEPGGTVLAVCPWGNRFRCHAPAPEFGDTQLGMCWVALDVPSGTAPGIARFYRDIMAASADVTKIGGAPAATVSAGRDQRLLYVETNAKIPEYDGHHVQIYLADFSGPYRRLMDHGLISMETDAHEWRFQDIVDLDSGKPLFRLEHEVRSMKHPLYARPLVNRNTEISNRNYPRGGDAFRGRF
ncbi:MAG: VOC family protein [Gemmatimonadaceae bacterium]